MAFNCVTGSFGLRRRADHIPGSIQPHRLMLVVDADSLMIRHVDWL
jgi:light-regulated signal transduction histidine kinase (bacteriophytochrome)